MTMASCALSLRSMLASATKKCALNRTMPDDQHQAQYTTSEAGRNILAMQDCTSSIDKGSASF